MRAVRLISLLAAFALGGAAGCARPPEPPLRFGGAPWPGYEPFYIARTQGLFPPGSVHLAELLSYSQTLTAFRNGSLDAAATTLDEALRLQQDRFDLRIVQVIDTSHGGDALVGRPGVGSVRELRGKRIGVEKAAFSAFLLARALESAGMTPSDVQTLQLSQPDAADALRTQRVDAAIVSWPFKQATLDVGGKSLFDSSRIPGEIVDVLIVRKTTLEGRENEIKMLISRWFEAAAAIRAKEPGALELIARREGITPALTEKALDQIRLLTLEENLALLENDGRNFPKAQSVADAMLRAGLVKSMPRLHGLFDPGLVRQIARERAR